MAFDFGPLSATSDRDILDYFYVTPQAREMVAFDENKAPAILVARQGTGKSALTLWLRAAVNGDVTLSMSPDTHRINTTDEDLTTSDLEYLIRTELLIDVCLRAGEKLTARSALKTRIKTICQDGWWDATVAQLVTIRGGSLFGFGLQVQPAERARHLDQLRKKFGPINDGVLTKLARDVATQKRVLIVVDNPENIVGQGIDTLSDLNAQRVGAFLGALADVRHLGVRLACFVKEQTYQHVRRHFTDFQHVADLVGGLSWRDEDLLGLVLLRVRNRFNLEWDDVFAEQPAALARAVFPYLSNGPRDLIRLLNLAGDSDRITTSQIIARTSTLRKERMEDLQSQYRQWPNLGTVVEELVAAVFVEDPEGRFARGMVNQLFRNLYNNPDSQTYRVRQGADWLGFVASGAPSMEQLLFTVGFLGYIGDDRDPRQPWNSRDSDAFSNATRYFIGALFRPA